MGAWLSKVKLNLGPNPTPCAFGKHTHAHTYYSTRPGGQDSVVRLLLGVEVLQPKLVDCLLEKVVSFLNDDDELALLLVSQLKWLDRVVEGEVSCAPFSHYVTHIWKCRPDPFSAHHVGAVQEAHRGAQCGFGRCKEGHDHHAARDTGGCTTPRGCH